MHLANSKYVVSSNNLDGDFLNHVVKSQCFQCYNVDWALTHGVPLRENICMILLYIIIILKFLVA